MSRSDGSFPSYTKYNVDPDQWPPSYWDHSYRCKQCATHWPQTPFFVVSPCCDAPTGKADDPPDMRWPEAIEALHHARFDKLYEEWNEDKSDEDLSIDAAFEEIRNIDVLNRFG